MTHLDEPVSRPEAVMNPVKLGGLAGAAVTSVGGVVYMVIDGVTGDELTPLGVAVGAAVTAVAALGVYVSALFAGRAVPSTGEISDDRMARPDHS